MNSFLKLIVVVAGVLTIHSCKEDPLPPVITTNEVTAISTTYALSGGTLKSDGGVSVTSKGICWSTAEKPTVADHKTTETTTASSFNSELTQLLPKTKYYVRAYATNIAGTGYGPEVSFTTLGSQPGANAASATNIQTSSATISGSVNPFLLPTTVAFEWGTSSNYGNTLSGSENPIDGNTPVTLSVNLTNLTPGTLYRYRIKAENTLGITYSNEVTFKTLGDSPSIQINDATNITLNSAVLNGSVNPNHLATTVSFEWGISTEYGNSIPISQNPLIGSSISPLSIGLSGLSPGITYHYRIRAENSLGITLSADKTFKTLGDAPSAEPRPAVNIQYNSATITGRVNPNYLDASVVFEWGETDLYGNTAPASLSPISGHQFVDISADILALDQGTTYHFRLRAENDLGITYSNDMTFTTLAPIADVEGNLYDIRTIGTQIWMTENLKTSKYNNNDPLSTTTPATLDISAEETPKYQWSYNGIESNADTYGRLYTWYAATDPRGVCPTGWHVPAEYEWTILINYLTNNGFGYEGSGDDIAKSLASQTGWVGFELSDQTPGSIGNNPSANNSSKFNALPAGARVTYSGGLEFSMLGTSCAWMTASEIDNRLSMQIILQVHVPTVMRTYYGNKKIGISVRCVKN